MKKHEPVPEKAMRWISPQRTICQVLRDIYWRVDDEKTRLWCREATSMAKSMTQRLVEVKGEEFVKTFWEDNPEFAEFAKWKEQCAKKQAD